MIILGTMLVIVSAGIIVLTVLALTEHIERRMNRTRDRYKDNQ